MPLVQALTCRRERTEMFGDFNHLHGQVISGNLAALAHAGATMRALIDLEE